VIETTTVAYEIIHGVQYYRVEYITSTSYPTRRSDYEWYSGIVLRVEHKPR